MPGRLGPSDKKQLRSIVATFPKKRVLVIGDFMLDHYIRGSVSRISPEAPVPVVRVSAESALPGGAGNVSTNLAALGARVSAIGVIGDDEAGRALSADLGSRGVALGLLVDRARVTSQKCRVVAERQQVVRYDRETPDPLSRETEGRLLELLPKAVAEADAVVLSDYGKGVIGPAVVRSALAAARARRVPVTVDPKIEHFKLYRRVTCITPNLMEAFGGMGRPLPSRDGQRRLEDLGRDILRTLQCESVLITRGPDGMSLFKPGRLLHIPTRAREVFDVTGAGDTVIATLTLALAAGAKIEAAAAIANHAAGLVVAKLGTATTSVSELEAALR